jgi:hypothetical protein
MQTARGLNLIEVSGAALLLTATAGNAIHLTREAAPEEVGQPAAPDHYLSDLEQVYDKTALLEPRWAATTLCGRDWILMASEEEETYAEASFAPSCRRCLALMDSLFPEPKLNDRFDLVVQVITDNVAEHGYAEMWHVPGDQQAALRKQVRSEVRKRTGYGIQTIAPGTMVVFVCEPISEQHRDERMRAATEAMSSVLTGEAAAPLPTPWRMSWDTWAAE